VYIYAHHFYLVGYHDIFPRPLPAIMVRIALPLTGVLAALPFLSAHPALPSVVSRNLRGGCVAEPPAEFISAAIEISSLDDAEFSSLSDDGIEGSVKTPKLPIPVRPIIVKTWMHVVAASKKPEDGWLSQGQLWDQFQVLNENFGNYAEFLRQFNLEQS
jgi:hypothetical protein